LAAFVTPRSPPLAVPPAAAVQKQEAVTSSAVAPPQGGAVAAGGASTSWRTLLAGAAAALFVVAVGVHDEFGFLAPGPPPALADRQRGTAASGMKVNKDAPSLLQYALPLEETIGEQAAAPVRLLQQKVEATREQAQLRLWGQLSDSLSSAQSVYKKDKAKLLKPIVAERQAQAEEILTKLDAELEALDKAGQGAIASAAGSVQDIAGAADVVERGRAAQALVGELEELMVPPGYVAPIPQDVIKYFPNLPKLDGRARVELTVKRAPGSTEKKFNDEGKLYKEAKFEIVVDGWSAPLTSGNFVDLVNRGFYDGKTFTRADGFITQFGDSGKENGNGFKPEGATKVRRIPLELALRGSKEAIYSETVDEAGKVGIPMRMPFSADGVLAMARAEFDNDSASSQVFLFVFESDMTPAGKNFMDGRYSTFGYTVKGAEFLRQVREGDVITSAKVLSGLDKLKA